jgi:transcription initiation factor TFIIB
MICTECGAAIEAPEVMQEVETREALAVGKSGQRSREVISNPLTLHDFGLSTTISDSVIDARGGLIDPKSRQALYRMKRLNKFATNRSRQRSLTSAFFMVNTIRQKLCLSEAITQKAAHIYRKALSNGLVRGRSIKGMVVASTYAACREFNAAKTVEELSKAIDADANFSMRCFNLLVTKFEFCLPRLDSTAYLSKAANTLEIRGKVYKSALEILKAVNAHHISQGKNPKALAAASIYLAASTCKERPIALAKVAVACDVTVISIRKRVLDIKQHQLDGVQTQQHSV